MWRKLLRFCHPNTGGDGDLFVCTRALYEHVAGNSIKPPQQGAERQPPSHPTTGEQIDYTGAYDKAGSFAELTAQALQLADDVPTGYGRLLQLLDDCTEAPSRNSIAYGYCHCGCGERTNLVRSSNRSQGLVKGEPRRYLRGHQHRRVGPEYVKTDTGHVSPCWIWQHNIEGTTRYGRVYRRGRAVRAHRYYYEKQCGPIPKGHQVH